MYIHQYNGVSNSKGDSGTDKKGNSVSDIDIHIICNIHSICVSDSDSDSDSELDSNSDSRVIVIVGNSIVDCFVNLILTS